MSRDDYWDRIQSSNDYLDRITDRTEGEITQGKIRDDVFDGIRSGDRMKVELALGITRGRSSEASPVGKTFRDYLASLIVTLESSSFLDAGFVEEWVGRMRGMSAGLRAKRILYEFATAYDRIYQSARPRRDVFNLRIDDEMRFDAEKNQIVRDTQALWRILGGA